MNHSMIECRELFKKHSQREIERWHGISPITTKTEVAIIIVGWPYQSSRLITVPVYTLMLL